MQRVLNSALVDIYLLILFCRCRAATLRLPSRHVSSYVAGGLGSGGLREELDRVGCGAVATITWTVSMMVQRCHRF
ncbi:hypothetical protein NL676_029305 [Syzygium grande]|nr:hypothetical protein NL676_029305 [Syzygium grande]